MATVERRAPRQAAPRQSTEVPASEMPASATTARSCARPSRSIPAWAEAGPATPVVGRADDEAEREADRLALHARTGGTPLTVPPTGQGPPDPGGRTGGQPLPGAVRATMGARLGVDLGEVRVHTGPAAEAAADRLGALAVTSGTDIAFGRGHYAPGTTAGDALLAHELAHVALAAAGQTPSGPLRRQPDPAAPQHLKDPISGTALAGYGFWAVGPDFTAAPTSEADIRQVLIENNLVSARTLEECRVQQFQTPFGSSYFAYLHPTLGVVARAGGAPISHPLHGTQTVGTQGVQPTMWSVFAYVRDDVGLTLRPLGGTGQTRVPSQPMGTVSSLALATGSDVQAALRLIEARLASLARRYPTSDAALGPAIVRAKADAAALRMDIVAGSAQTSVIEMGTVVLEAADHDLSLLDQQAAKLVAQGAPHRSVEALRRRYAAVFDHLFQPDVRNVYDDVQRWAERLPEDLLLDALWQHGSVNEDVLVPSAILVDWGNDLRAQLGSLYALRKQLGAKPDDPALIKSIQDKAAFLEAAFRGIQLWDQYLAADENFLRDRPGILDLPLIDAMYRIRARLDSAKAAYDARDTANLKARVDALDADEAIRDFYRALPAGMHVIRTIAKIGVTTLAAMASGGAGGLLADATGAATTGTAVNVVVNGVPVVTITIRGALAALGTATLEAATFTAITSTADKFLFGEKVTFGSALKDFAWSVGLFSALRGMSGVSEGILRAAQMEVLTMPVQLTSGFALAHGLGVLQFRIMNDRWPSQAELDQMTAESVLMLAGIALGSAVTQRWLQNRQDVTRLRLLQREYGWRFAALLDLRGQLANRVRAAEAAGRGNDPAELTAIRADAQTLERSIQDLIQVITKDKRFMIAQIRQELNSLRDAAPDIAAAALGEALAIPAEVGLRRTGSASYTYANGRTGALERPLRQAGYRVDKAMDPVSGIHGLQAMKANAQDIYFEERSAGGLDFDAGAFDVQKLMADLRLTDHRAQRMLLRMLSETRRTHGVKGSASAARKEVEKLAAAGKKGAEEALIDLYQTGRLRSTASPQLAAIMDRLLARDILASGEWLAARDEANRQGVVGEWLAKEAIPPAAGARVYRRVTVQGDLFEDPAATVAAKDAQGNPRVNEEVTEADLVYGRDVGGSVTVDTVISVKTSGGRDRVKSAVQQNEIFRALLAAKPGDVVRVQMAEGSRYAKVRSVAAYDGNQPVDLTGKLVPGSALTAETVGPRGAGRFSKSLAQDTQTISAVSDLLYEQQLIRGGDY